MKRRAFIYNVINKLLSSLLLVMQACILQLHTHPPFPFPSTPSLSFILNLCDNLTTVLINLLKLLVFRKKIIRSQILGLLKTRGSGNSGRVEGDEIDGYVESVQRKSRLSYEAWRKSIFSSAIQTLGILLVNETTTLHFFQSTFYYF